MAEIVNLGVRRIPRLLLTIFAVSTVTFVLITLIPGDPAVLILGANNLTTDSIQALDHKLGVDQPLPIRYGQWLLQVARGDLGYSYLLNDSVGNEIVHHLPASVELMALALLIALALAIPLGILAAYRSGEATDRAISILTFSLLAVPGFVMALLLILLTAVKLRILPATGWVNLFDDPLLNLRSALLPAASLALPQLAVFTRLLRSEMISTLQEEFVAMARAKGVPTARILLVHALKPSSFSLVTVVGIQVGVLMSGTVIVESIFAIPGIGSLLLNGISSHDYQLVPGLTLFIAAVFVTVNFIVDMIYLALDPRIRTRALI
jgi:peptide/nickel transport system permease protein